MQRFPPVDLKCSSPLFSSFAIRSAGNLWNRRPKCGTARTLRILCVARGRVRVPWTPRTMQIAWKYFTTAAGIFITVSVKFKSRVAARKERHLSSLLRYHFRHVSDRVLYIFQSRCTNSLSNIFTRGISKLWDNRKTVKHTKKLEISSRFAWRANINETQHSVLKNIKILINYFKWFPYLTHRK